MTTSTHRTMASIWSLVVPIGKLLLILLANLNLNEEAYLNHNEEAYRDANYVIKNKHCIIILV